MPKISELPEYDSALTDPDDFFPVVQDNQTKRLTVQAITEAKVIREGHTSNPPTRAQLQNIFGPLDTDANFVLRDTTGAAFVYIVVYHHAEDTWWIRRMNEAS